MKHVFYSTDLIKVRAENKEDLIVDLLGDAKIFKVLHKYLKLPANDMTGTLFQEYKLEDILTVQPHKPEQYKNLIPKKYDEWRKENKGFIDKQEVLPFLENHWFTLKPRFLRIYVYEVKGLHTSFRVLIYFDLAGPQEDGYFFAALFEVFDSIIKSKIDHDEEVDVVENKETDVFYYDKEEV